MISLNISQEEDSDVEDLARKQSRTKTEIIREAIRRYVAEEKRRDTMRQQQQRQDDDGGEQANG